MVKYVEDKFLLTVEDGGCNLTSPHGISSFLEYRQNDPELQFRLYAFTSTGEVRECRVRALPMRWHEDDWGDAQFMILDGETNVQIAVVGYRIDGRA